MAHKELKYDAEARAALQAGVDAVANAVKVTLGPKGRYVVLDKKFGAPDDHQRRRHHRPRDRGRGRVREPGRPARPRGRHGDQRRRRRRHHDGDPAGPDDRPPRASRTSPPAPTRWRCAAGSRRPSTRWSRTCATSSRRRSRGKEQIARVAAISAADDEIGNVIADAIEKVGKDGVVNVEEGQTFGMELEFTEGMQFDKGYISPYMVTDQDRMEAVLEDPYILIANQKIGSVRDMLPVLEQVMQGGKPLRDRRRGRRGRVASRPWSSTSSAAPSPASPSRRPASATAASGCSRTSRSSPAAR